MILKSLPKGIEAMKGNYYTIITQSAISAMKIL